jgi:hypothetical protein
VFGFDLSLVDDLGKGELVGLDASALAMVTVSIPLTNLASILSVSMSPVFNTHGLPPFRNITL